MLSLGRKQGEKIVIGKEPNIVVITLVSVSPSRAVIGIQAGPEVPIHRQEVYDRIQLEQKDQV